MQTLIYEGKIEPGAAPLTLDYRPKLLRQETETTPEAEFEVTVFVGRVRVRVTTSVVGEEVASDLYFAAWDVARTFVETAGCMTSPTMIWRSSPISASSISSADLSCRTY
jgi:hypothetical protein